MTGTHGTKYGESKEGDRGREEETNDRHLRLNVQSARRGCGGDEILDKRNLSSSLRAEEGCLQVLPVGQWPPFPRSLPCGERGSPSLSIVELDHRFIACPGEGRAGS